MNQNELKLSATYIKKLASLPDAEERISLYLDTVLQNPLRAPTQFRFYRLTGL